MYNQSLGFSIGESKLIVLHSFRGRLATSELMVFTSSNGSEILLVESWIMPRPHDGWWRSEFLGLRLP